MPIYQYACPVCSIVIEVLAKADDAPPNTCHLCFQQGQAFTKMPTIAHKGAIDTTSQKGAPSVTHSDTIAPNSSGQTVSGQTAHVHVCKPGCTAHGRADELIKQLDRS